LENSWNRLLHFIALGEKWVREDEEEIGSGANEDNGKGKCPEMERMGNVD
jgi:hypothetical protein